MDSLAFQEIIWEKGRELFRPMPWREDTRPYFVLVSEIMLQQTQVERVVPKFEAFIERFPDIVALAQASLAEVLQLWSGLGYNRRAKFLHQAAQRIVHDYDGVFPTTERELMMLPGVGKNTAGALLAYSFNQPAVFIETNVRTVYFHHFFEDQPLVTDKELAVVVAKTVDTEHPREWYWAIMDYGTALKQAGGGRLDKSHHYKKQPPLKGSVREVRGQILKALAGQPYSEDDLRKLLTADDRFSTALEGLRKDELVSETDGRLHLSL